MELIAEVFLNIIFLARMNGALWKHVVNYKLKMIGENSNGTTDNFS
jgi:hypothetical protein